MGLGLGLGLRLGLGLGLGFRLRVRARVRARVRVGVGVRVRVRGRVVPPRPRHLPQMPGRLQLERKGWSMVSLCQSSLYSNGRDSMVAAHWYE